MKFVCASHRLLAKCFKATATLVSCTALTFPALIWVGSASVGFAQPTLSAQLQKSKPTSTGGSVRRRLVFRLPDRGAPGSREWGGVRNAGCVKGQKKLTALLPTTNLGYTISTHPTLLIYVPEVKADTAEFILEENQRDSTSYRRIYSTKLSLKQTSGFVSVTLPPNISPLEVDRQYRWSFMVMCDADDFSGNPTVEGWIQRVEASSTLRTNLQQSPVTAHAAIYAESGIWFEALSSLAKQRQDSPHDQALLQDWRDLLESVKLDPRLALEPWLKCCTATQ
jgi:hypothetical protein